MPDARGGLGVAEAAKKLGITPAALRRRIDRRTVESYKGEDGRWYVIVPDDGDTGSTTSSTTTEEAPGATIDAINQSLVQTLRDQLNFLQHEVERRDREVEEMRRDHAREIQELHVMLQTAQRMIPANVPDPRESSVRPAERSTPYEARREANTAPEGVQRERVASEASPRAWWKRLLGVE